jgi:replicative DNA helicase
MEFKVSIHHSEEAEQDLLGICLLEPHTAVKVCQHCHEDWFYIDLHKATFKAIRSRVAQFKDVDTLTITEDLVQEFKSRKYQGDNLSYLITKMTKNVVSGVHIFGWIEIIEKLHAGRQIESLSSIALSELSTEQKKAKIEAIMNESKVVKNKTSWLPIGNAIENYLNFYLNNKGKPVIGHEIGLKRLDWLLGGFRNETLTIIGARPSIGKSAFGMQAILNIANIGAKVGVVSIEMGNNELISRMLSYSSGIDYNDIFRLKVPIDEIQRQLIKLQDLGIFFSDQTKCSIEGIRASVIQLVGKNALDIVFIDYLQLMSSEEKTNTKNDEVGKITAGLKELSRRLKIPVVALAQLNRSGTNEPTLETLRDSGNIEQDADVVLFLHGDRELQDRQAIIAKNRNGKLGKESLKFIGENMKFIEVENLQQIKEDTF